MLKKTLTITALAAAMAMPVFAAGQVADNAAAVTANADQGQVQNAQGFATDFDQPNKGQYNKGNQVKIESQLINNDNQLILYPQVTAKDPKAAEAINKQVKNFVATISAKHPKVMSLYDIKADGDGIFSYVTFTNDASDDKSPAEIVGFTYNTKTGAAMQVSDFGKFDVNTLNKVLKADPDVSPKLPSDFTGLTQMPPGFYVAQGKTVYSIIPEGTILPKEEGTLFVPLNAKK